MACGYELLFFGGGESVGQQYYVKAMGYVAANVDVGILVIAVAGVDVVVFDVYFVGLLLFPLFALFVAGIEFYYEVVLRFGKDDALGEGT